MALARCNLVITDESGDIVDGATVEVRRESDLGLPALFSDRAGIASLGNSYVAADGADAGFYVAGGSYKITATLGAFARTWRYVAIGTAAEFDSSAFAPAIDALAPWANAFFAATAVITFGAADVTVTHSTNALAFAGASSGYSFDSLIQVPRLVGGSGAASTLTIDATLGTGLTDKILFRTGAQVQMASMETAPRTGGVAIMGLITPGSGYTNGTYNGVALTGGTGTGATANITVAGGVVTVATIVAGGSGYTFGDSLSAAAASIGGTGTGFAVQAGVGNSYTPVSGSPQGFYHSNVGGADNVRALSSTMFDIPGISPLPAAGQMFLMANYADSSPGNISNLYAVAWNSGNRYTAAITGIAASLTGSTGINLWGAQFSAVAYGTAGGVLTGINCQCDFGSSSIIAIPLQLKLGDSGSGGTHAGNSFISMLADAGRGALNALRFQANSTSPIDSTGAMMQIEGANLSCALGIDISTGTFSTAAFRSPGFIVGPTGTFGYNTGAGGTVTQITNRTTAVTLNKPSGAITTHNASLAAGATARFTCINSHVAATDTVLPSIKSGTTTDQTDVKIENVAAGTFDIVVANRHASTAETGAIVINFNVIKAVIS